MTSSQSSIATRTPWWMIVSPSAGIDPRKSRKQLKSFKAAVQSSEELRTVLASPAVSVARKRLVIRRIAEALGLERIVLNFLLVSADHRRETALPELIDAFELLLDERLGLQRAEVSRLPNKRAQRDRHAGEWKNWPGSGCGCDLKWTRS